MYLEEWILSRLLVVYYSLLFTSALESIEVQVDSTLGILSQRGYFNVSIPRYSLGLDIALEIRPIDAWLLDGCGGKTTLA